LGNNDGGGRVDVGAQEQEEMVAPSTSKKPSAISNKSVKPVDKKQEATMMKRTIKQRRQIPAIPNKELLARQHLICQLIRNISLSSSSNCIENIKRGIGNVKGGDWQNVVRNIAPLASYTSFSWIIQIQSHFRYKHRKVDFQKAFF
jgi:hypothetical protein